jgi:putative sigma-54 modulation protein
LEGAGFMNVIVSGRNIEVTNALKEAMTIKLEKFEKYFRRDIDAKATMSVTKGRHTVEVTIPLFNGVILRAEESSNDMYVSIDRVVDKLSAQLRKYKTKLEKRYHANDTIKYESIPVHEEESQELKIVKTKKFPVKPMDPEEAVLQMEMLGHDFFVFRNGETDEINVVYQRKDGEYGLIEPFV